MRGWICSRSSLSFVIYFIGCVTVRSIRLKKRKGKGLDYNSIPISPNDGVPSTCQRLYRPIIDAILTLYNRNVQLLTFHKFITHGSHVIICNGMSTGLSV